MNAALLMKAISNDIGAGQVPHKGLIPATRESTKDSVYSEATSPTNEDIQTHDRQTNVRKPAAPNFTQTLNKQMGIQTAGSTSSGKKTGHPGSEPDHIPDVAILQGLVLSIPSVGQPMIKTIKGENGDSHGSIPGVALHRTTKADLVPTLSSGLTTSVHHHGPITSSVSISKIQKDLQFQGTHSTSDENKRINTAILTTRKLTKEVNSTDPSTTSNKNNGSVDTGKALTDLIAGQSQSSQHTRTAISSKLQDVPFSSAVTHPAKDLKTGKETVLISPNSDKLGSRPTTPSDKAQRRGGMRSTKFIKQSQIASSSSNQILKLQTGSTPAPPGGRSAVSSELKDNQLLDTGMKNEADLAIEVNELISVSQPIETTGAVSLSGSNNKALEPAYLSMQISQQIQTSITPTSTLDGRTLMVSLDPPELGKVSITFQEQDGVVTGLLEVSKPQTRFELQQTLPDIVQQLQASGIHIKSLDVALVNPSEPQDDTFVPTQDQSFEHPNDHYHESHRPGDSENEHHMGYQTWSGPHENIRSESVLQDRLVSKTEINLLI